MKRHYTREQLEFYFKKLQESLRKVPTEEEMAKARGYPSITVYRERFGSWNRACELFENKLLMEKQCKNCRTILHAKNKDWKFCSHACQREYQAKTNRRRSKSLLKKGPEVLGKKCVICGFDAIVEIHDTQSKTDSPTRLALHLKKGIALDRFVVLCLNHHQMIHKGLGKLSRTEHGWKLE